MTTINKLSIKGIRSFGIDRDDEQKIEFSSPLTLIVGQNGCGKTTVIECLKYALTGDKPPGTDNGRTFVHDPKISKVQVAMAQVKLTVTNSRMVEKTVVRSIRSEIQKNDKLKLTTLDSTICTIEPGKPREDITGRVEDINTNMCQFMGVSKAIINNVIFCHQEDSNWPMDEGKKLKEKFDAIFGTTEYNKAIEKFIKMRKTFQAKLVEKQGDKKLNQEIKEQAEAKEMSRRTEQEKCTVIEEQLKTAKDKMYELEKKKEEILKREQNLSELMQKRLKYKSVIESKTDDYMNLKVKLKRQLSGDIQVLEQSLSQFYEDQQKKESQKEKLKKECSEIANNETKCQQTIGSSTVKLQSIGEKIGVMQDLSGKRFENVRNICEKLDIPFDDLDQSVDTQQVSGTYENIQEKINEEEDHIEMMKVEAEESDKVLQAKIDKLREERTKLDAEIVNLSKLIKSTEENRTKIKEEITSCEQSIPVLQQLRPKIEKAENNLEDLKKNASRIESLKDDQQMMEADITELEDKLQTINNEIEILHASSKITNELELKKSDLAVNQKDFDRIKNKILPSLKTLFGSKVPESNYRTHITKKKEGLESEVKSIKDQLLSLQRECDRMVDRRSNLRKQIDGKSADLKKIQDDIDEVCKGNDYKSYLGSQKEKVAKLNMELAVLRSSENTFTDYIKKIGEHPNCPLCHKGFEHDEGDVIKVELEESIQELPKKIDSIEKKFKAEQKVYDKLNGYKSAFDSIEKYQIEKSKLESEVKKIDEQMKENAENKEMYEAQLAEPEATCQMITPSFVADACKLDDLQRNIASKAKDVDAIAAKVPKNIPKKSLDEAKDEQKKFYDQLKTKKEETKKNNEEINSFQQKLNEAHSKVNDLNAQKNKFQEKVQGIERLKEQYMQLETDAKKNEQKLKESKTKITPVANSLKAATDEKQKSRDESTKKINDCQKKLNELKLEMGEIERLNKQLTAYQNMNLQSSHQEEQKILKRAKEQLKELQEKHQNKSKEIEAINDEIANEETTRRNILDNIELQKIEKVKQEAQEQCSALSKSFGDGDIAKFRKDKMNISSEIEKLNVEIGRLSGTLGTLQSACQAIQNQLNDKKYKNAQKDYMNSIYEVFLLQTAIEDLNKYRNALEKSLLKFHQDKMDQINQLLREYWNAIYQGNDIDYILIKTDEDDPGKATVSDKKRTYSYRVVQSKNGSEVDMRGRCSAGQKVLASLIIRMALADTFSANCGILALDEPTTNLDSANIRSLCAALARIVAERDDESGKFMLLVITHDEEFANALERAEHYWKLSRDRRGCSRIEKINNY